MVAYLARYTKTVGFLLDILTMVVDFYLAYILVGILVGHPIFAYMKGTFVETEALCYVSWTLAIALLMEYPSRRKKGGWRDLHSVLTINLTALLILSVSVFLVKGLWMSRMFVLMYLITQVFIMFLNRYMVRLVLYMLRHSGWDLRTRILIGTNQNAAHYLEEVAANKRFGLRMLGYLADSPRELGIPYLGSLENLERTLATHAPDGVVMALPVTNPYVEQAVKVCNTLGISMELLLDGLSSQIASSAVHHGSTVSVLTLSAIPHTPTLLLVKRMTDIAISAAALVLLSPIFLAIAVAVKLEDGGPVLFVQERVGLHNKRFSMYKFRSMCVNAESLKGSLLHLNEMSGPVFKITNDPRVTRIGTFLRKTSLDELPQMWNVLTGSMSLVGPRPPLPSEVAQYDGTHRRRLSVKPGLTCLWQVAGRNDIDFDRWIELDLAYIDNWSYLGDLKIIFQTIPAVLKRHGAR